jgi:hypothetical protein
MPMRVLRHFFVVALLSACGAGAQATNGASSADGTGTGDSDSQGLGDGESGSEAGPKGPDCSDGTCFSCGDGFCPKGFYCDRKSGGCSWLPECAQEASCACVSRVLSDCSCTEDSGGVYCD